jgi:ribosome-binding protein aMBF1 (putative translation factor)
MNKDYFFICEICKEKTPIECEGSEPNTCAECMPIFQDEQRSDYE